MAKDIVVDLAIRYGFQVVGALVILAVGLSSVLGWWGVRRTTIDLLDEKGVASIAQSSKVPVTKTASAWGAQTRNVVPPSYGMEPMPGRREGS